MSHGSECQRIEGLFNELLDAIKKGASVDPCGEGIQFVGFSPWCEHCAVMLFAASPESDGILRAYPYGGASTLEAQFADRLLRASHPEMF